MRNSSGNRRYRHYQLARWLNGLPPSVREIEMLYSGGLDPTQVPRETLLRMLEAARVGV